MSDATPPRRIRYSFEARCRAVEAMWGWLVAGEAGAAVGASHATAYRWRARYLAEGWSGLRERPSTPLSHPRRLALELEAEILAIRVWTQSGAQAVGAIVGPRHPRSARYSGAWDSRGSIARRGRRWCATSASGPANLCASTPRSRVDSGMSGSGSGRTVCNAVHAPGSSTSMSPSTTIRASPTPRCPHRPRGGCDRLPRAGVCLVP